MKIERLKEIREDKDLLQKDIAKILNITQVQYSRYETGLRVIPVYHLEKLALFYHTSALLYNLFAAPRGEDARIFGKTRLIPRGKPRGIRKREGE